MEKAEAPPLQDAQRPRMPSLSVRTARTVVALMLREMTTTYGRSAGGYLWALLEPVGGIILLTTVISAGLQLRKPSLGISFAMFYATGILSFQLYLRMQQKISQSITYSRALLRYPAVTFVDAILARFLINMITQAAILFIVIGTIVLMFDTRTIFDPVTVMLGLAMAGMLALGIGTMN
ncbi:MAG: sugar ABC transporter permease, partial [Paracoccaceae bacterium]|nr:sugar ABC transporter permease [Paracoccaceae bacterium]